MTPTNVSVDRVAYRFPVGGREVELAVGRAGLQAGGVVVIAETWSPAKPPVLSDSEQAAYARGRDQFLGILLSATAPIEL
jgi:hypothetical protein